MIYQLLYEVRTYAFVLCSFLLYIIKIVFNNKKIVNNFITHIIYS